MADNPVIIAGSLSDEKLKESIKELVTSINNGMGEAATKFDDGLKNIETRLKTFTTNAKNTVGEINNAFKSMGTTFDEFAKAMEKASKAATSSGGAGSRGGAGGGTSSATVPNSVGELRVSVAEAQKLADTYQVGSTELRNQVNLIESLKAQLKEALKTDKQRAEEIEKKLSRQYSTQLTAIGRMPDNELKSAESKLNALLKLKNDLRSTPVLDDAKMAMLNKRIQEVINKVRELRSTPKSLKDVLGMDENSVEAISRKMSALKRVQIDPNNKAQVQQLANEYQRLGRVQNEMLGRNAALVRSNFSLAQSFGYIRNRIAYALTLGAATSFINQVYEIRSQYELLERSLGVLVNSFERGSQIFQELNAMAIQSPFTLMELAGAAKQLTAYDFAAKEVVDTTRRLADISAALGVPMERLTYNLGQIRAQGVLNARDARDFANAGLPIVKSLADMYTELQGRMVSTGEVYDMMSKKQVSYNDVMSVLYKMTDDGGKFFEFQAKQAQTLRVQMANLTLAWNNMLNDIGTAEQSTLELPIKSLKLMFENWKDIAHVMQEVVAAFGVYKAYQITAAALAGTTAAALNKQVLAEKESVAVNLRKKALTESLTASELRLLATSKQITAEDYRNALSSKNLTKQKALLLAALNANNVQLKAALIQMGLLTAAEARSITVGKAMAIVFKSIGVSIASIAKGIGAFMASNWIFIAIGAVYELYHAFSSAKEEVNELNKSLRDTAKESAESLENFLSNKGNKSARELAKQNKLSNEDGEKTWEAIRTEIETSSMAANSFIGELVQIEDINERVAKGFEYAESIKNAQYALQDLKDDSIEFTQSIWKGMFGEGLVDDLKDVAKTLPEYAKLINIGYGEDYAKYHSNFSKQQEEFRRELDVTANSLKNYLDAYGITDPLQMREIMERVRAQIKASNPEIRGELATIFDVSFDQRMYELTGGAIDQNTSLWKVFLERLKHDSGAAFQGITEEIYTESGKLSKEQQAAVDKALDYFKGTMPQYYDAVKNMVADASQLKVNIGVAFNVQQLNDLQKEVKKRIDASSSALDFGENPLPQVDNLSQWTKELQDNIKKLSEENAKYEKDGTAWAKEKIEYNNRIISQEKNKLDLFHQEYEAEKKTKGRSGSKKDPILDALKQEIDIVKKLQSEYDKLTQKGATQAEALETVQSAFGKTLSLVNKDLKGFGLPQLDLSIITGKDPNKQLEHFKKTLDELVNKGLINLERAKTLEATISELTLSAKTYNLDKITKGLNSELSKLKDEYELAVELDANPELGGMFADMLGLDDEMLKDLPNTFGQALDKANEIVKQKLKELNIDAKDFDLLQTNIKADDKGLWGGVDISSATIQDIIKWQTTFRDMFKKNLVDTENMLDDYVKKYGGYADKIAEIEADRLSKIKQLNDAYYTEQMRKAPEYIAKLNAINKGAEREKQSVGFEEFKNSRYYTMMFENLDYVSTKTIRDMRDRLRELMDTMNELTPEQLKQVMSQYEKLEEKLVKRSPFKTLAKDFKEYIKTTKDRKAANEEFRNVQKQYDAQNKLVAAKKEEYEQAKADKDTEEGKLTTLAEELGVQEGILQKLKEQVDAASNKADKYNLTAKLAKSELLAVANVVATNLQSLGELRDFLQEDFGIELGNELNGLIDGLGKAADGISKVVSSATSGDVVGVAVGVGNIFTGLADGIASIFGDGAARTKRINKEIERSVETVRKLNMAYKQLEHTIEKAMGSAEISARRAAIANKEQQLAELEKQVALEKSKRSKDRDDNAIKQGEESIQDLRLEIENLKDDVVNTLLGSDVKSAAEEFVDTWVQAWKAGETTLDAMEEKMDEFIYNLIKKSMTSQIVGTILDPLYKEIERMTSLGSEGGEELTVNELRQLAQNAGEYAGKINTALGEFYGNLEQLGIVSKTDESSKELSALQAGIQNITEQTAGSIEAYLNGVSQQVYLHSDLLTEIRDAVVMLNTDVTVATQAQILLQLQSNHLIIQSIHSLMEGWNNASGQALRVELVS